MVPFSPAQFFEVFARHNEVIWPAQFLAYGLVLPVLTAAVRPSASGDRISSFALAAMWLFTGVAYHWVEFSKINPVAPLFASAFVLQAGLLARAGLTGRIGLRFSRGSRAWVGIALDTYSTLVYPLIGLATHGYPAVPLFGITPCPVTIFTLGSLLITRSRVPFWVLAVPLLWAFIVGSAARLLRVPQDWVLLASGFVVITLEVQRLPEGS